jgi:putative ABC transport system ATP-binding protein
VSKEVNSPDGPIAILADVNLSVDAGESVAIIGPSGSGKSTLLALLAGLDVPTRGEVLLQGKSFSARSEDERARLRAGRVGFVFQAFHLIPTMTAEENVRLPLELAGIADAAQRARTVLTEVGLADRIRYPAARLSGGEQQRVALARAFVGRPAILFADEPTGNLDMESGARIANLLFELNRSAGTTLVLVTHEPSLAARCDRTLTLEGGRLAEAAVA